MIKRLLTLTTHRIHDLPVMVLMPHSRCNCRCVMCDIWKANHNKKEITTEELAKHLDAFRKLGVRRVALSGGEALMHSNLWKFCEQLKSIGITISLLSTGITLKIHAEMVSRYVDDVIVSLDGPPEVHNQIRNLPSAFEKLREGVAELKRINAAFPITARCVLQKLNFRYLHEIIETSQSLHLDQVSFLTADVSTPAFNRDAPWDKQKIVSIELNKEEITEFDALVKTSITRFSNLYETRFIAESPHKMLSLVQYYSALNGDTSFPVKKCNAPWVSAVIESDGEVRPCFFHASYGNIANQSFEEIINSEQAISFRKKLDMKRDNICERCVCSLHLGWLQ